MWRVRLVGAMVEMVAAPALKLSAVLIVHNEAHCLERCLRSVAPIADEIIVLDAPTGDLHADNSASNAPLTQLRHLARGQVFIDNDH